jgi:hypothetical protein
MRSLVLAFSLCAALAFPVVAVAGPTGTTPDVDADTVVDGFDNCTPTPNSLDSVNPAQRDVDHDGCGNRCDCDFSQNAVVDVADFIVLSADFGCVSGNCVADCTGDGNTTVADFVELSADFTFAPGPSGIPNANVRDFTACP